MICSTHEELSESGNEPPISLASRLQTQKDFKTEIVMVAEKEDTLCLLVDEAKDRGVIDRGQKQGLIG